MSAPGDAARLVAPVEDTPGDEPGSSPDATRLPGPTLRRRALDALYRAQMRRLMRLFNRRGNPQDAADMMQETFTRYAHALPDHVAWPDCPERYLTRVALNVLHDRGRYAARRSGLAIPIDEAVVTAPDLAVQIEARDMVNRIEAVMMELKPMTRDIFIARRVHGYSRAEIAAKTGLKVKAVDKHLARAVEHIRRHLEGCEGG